MGGVYSLVALRLVLSLKAGTLVKEHHISICTKKKCNQKNKSAIRSRLEKKLNGSDSRAIEKSCTVNSAAINKATL